MGRAWGRCTITALAGKFRAIPWAMVIVETRFTRPIFRHLESCFPIDIRVVYNSCSPRRSSGVKKQQKGKHGQKQNTVKPGNVAGYA
jgi:hypothetical protein